jgi:protein-S-isoprenylcysteine O-methyltransferase Ste14
MESGKVYVRWSLSLLTYGYILIMIATVTEYFVLQRKISYPITILGLLVYLGGLLGRKEPVKMLGKYWSPHVEIRENQKLIKEGLYRYSRHPYYLFLLIEVLGFTLIPNAYYTFLIGLIVYTSVIYVRIHYEEKALIEKFGQEYLDYKKEVPALLPLKFRGSR